jgi:hypothetical protein
MRADANRWPPLTFGIGMCWILFWTLGLAAGNHVEGAAGWITVLVMCLLTSLATARALFRNRSVRIVGAAMRGVVAGVSTYGATAVFLFLVLGALLQRNDEGGEGGVFAWYAALWIPLLGCLTAVSWAATEPKKADRPKRTASQN